MKKRGQAWGFDLSVAVMLFVAALVAFYLYALSYDNRQTSTASDLEVEARAIASSLLSEGVPENWESNTVVKIGLTSNKRLNETKVARFKDLAETDYGRLQGIFNTNRDWYILFSEPISVEGEEIQEIGNEPQQYTQLIKVERITNYDARPLTIYVEVWE